MSLEQGGNMDESREDINKAAQLFVCAHGKHLLVTWTHTDRQTHKDTHIHYRCMVQRFYSLNIL